MNVTDLFELPKNDRIKIDHYSWPLNSPYRVYEKEEFNRCCIEKIEEMSEKGTYLDDRALAAALVQGLYLDPSDLPEHPSWDDEEFEKAALNALFEIIETDRQITQKAALKLARGKRTRAKAKKDAKRQEVYERIVFELVEARKDEFEYLVKEVFGELQ